jgi:hypothetical protein
MHSAPARHASKPLIRMLPRCKTHTPTNHSHTGFVEITRRAKRKCCKSQLNTTRLECREPYCIRRARDRRPSGRSRRIGRQVPARGVAFPDAGIFAARRLVAATAAQRARWIAQVLRVAQVQIDHPNLRSGDRKSSEIDIRRRLIGPLKTSPPHIQTSAYFHAREWPSARP